MVGTRTVRRRQEPGNAADVVLGIESTAHTFGIAIIKGHDVIANITDSFTTESGGMIPAKVAQHHGDVYPSILARALEMAKEKAGIGIDDIRLIAYSEAPGIGHTLRIGAAVAKSLALRLRVPLVGVNHCIAHLEITRLVTRASDPVLLYCSGANTQVIAYDEGKYRIFGETLDTGVGNFLDTLARDMGLGFPGGPKIERLALNASADGRTPILISIPYSVKGMDVAFAGLQTNMLHKLKSGEFSKEDLAFSAQETVFAMLVETAERAMAHVGKEELVLGGGVGCNKRLQEMCRIMCEERGARFYCPENQYLVDNAAMIAWTGKLMFERGGVRTAVEDAAIKPYERTDDVNVTWR
ncbi:TPA: tRNA (adenosine(37)-N6)-threonylcarbamoyltransferase complex transferase subunit TsaD [Candidatus Woesearchaeota archaeon]|nr:tRNA (adenosine(37)-N6)-threonylcarbamoyltransferase complex transferase subunit TsaD [Candidatus Woesearchaeota archaeon]